MHWLILLVIIFIIMYVLNIVRAFLHLQTLRKLLEKIDTNIELIEKSLEENPYGEWKYDPTAFESFLNQPDQKECIYQLISFKPEIDEFLPYDSLYSRISYNVSLSTSYDNVRTAYNNLLMVENQLILDAKHSINPKFAVRQFFLLPSTLFSFVGFSFKKATTANLISALAWIAGFILKNYGDEIKTAIVELLLK